MIIEVYDSQGTTYAYHRGEESPLSEREALAQQNELFQVMITNNGELFDPHSATANIYKRDKQRGGYVYKLRKCSQVCFKYYVKFLATRNRRNLNIAQRRFIDG